MTTQTKRRIKHTHLSRCADKTCRDCFLSDGQTLDTWGLNQISALVGWRAPRVTDPRTVLRNIRAVVLATGRTPERHS